LIGLRFNLACRVVLGRFFGVWEVVVILVLFHILPSDGIIGKIKRLLGRFRRLMLEIQRLTCRIRRFQAEIKRFHSRILLILLRSAG
jgi:tRNA nucleotidyltransferase/poly(A) polymerase